MIIKLIKLGWWTILCLLPTLIFSTVKSLEQDIGYPQVGDCYLPGYFSIILIKAFALVTIALTWPAAIYRLMRKQRTNT